MMGFQDPPLQNHCIFLLAKYGNSLISLISLINITFRNLILFSCWQLYLSLTLSHTYPILLSFTPCSPFFKSDITCEKCYFGYLLLNIDLMIDCGHIES